MKQYNFTINGNNYSVTINSVEGNVADVTVTASYRVELGNGTSPVILAQTAATAVQQGAMPCQCAPEQQPALMQTAPVQTAPAVHPDAAPKASEQNAKTEAPAQPATGKSTKVTAPLPGNIVGISVKVGDSVKAGQQVAVLEAMKMENSIETPVAGTVTEILAAVGDAVAADAPIMTIA